MQTTCLVILLLGAPESAAEKVPTSESSVSEFNAAKLRELDADCKRLVGEGNLKGARDARRKIAAIITKAFGPNHWRTKEQRRYLEQLNAAAKLPIEDQLKVLSASEKERVAQSLMKRGHYKDALPSLESALRNYELALGQSNLAYAKGAMAAGWCALMTQRYEEAEAKYVRSLRLLDELVGSDHPLNVRAKSQLARVYQKTGRKTKAYELINEALERQERISGAQSLEAAEIVNALGGLQFERGNPEAAEASFRRVAASCEHHERTDVLLYAYAQENLALFYISRGEFDRAEVALRRAIAIREKRQSPDNPSFQAIRKRYQHVVSKLKEEEPKEEVSSS
ncbi:Tetratricopeptide repeat protein [Planctomycetes bacterium Pan216]|uniref:Tetratricopeptide repeat protein n=1 Tax=Kolteria novifilia TaxID=2527975 RepID=A0A518B2I5_9BACT|nr:Tetratricopeptide repeat protein [Planctomycetes bacterium Pan216]